MKMKIRLSDNDKTIAIPFGSVNNLLGYDDNIQTIVNGETNASVNNTSDLEVRRFNFESENTLTTRFSFWSGGTLNDYVEELAPYDFSGLTAGSNEARNSFYVMQVFDTYDESIQKKLHTGYFNGFDFLTKSGGLSTNYLIKNTTSEFLSIYINNSFIEEKNTPTIDLYVKFLFYSAKSAKFYPFAKTKYNLISAQEQIYKIIRLDTNTFKYSIPNIIGNSPLFFDSYEVYNSDYTTLINNTVNSIPVQKPDYPNGNTFTEDGYYITE